MKFNPPLPRIKAVVFLVSLVSIAAIVLAIRPTDAANLHKTTAPSTTSAISDGPTSIALMLVVNDAGDAADTNVGDSICDTSPTAGDQCTLRAAIQEANALAGDDAVTFSSGLNNTTIILNTALPEISGNLTITGPGAALLSVRRSSAGGTPNFRIFTILVNQTVAISNLSISNGSAAGVAPSGIGGGILNQGTLVINNCVVSGNSSSDGGGIANRATMTINNSTIGNNTAASAGGGISNGSGESQSGVLTINNSTISNNISQSFGGGGISNISTAFINNSTISTNAGANGGGITNANPMTLTNVTVSGNIGTNSGGGVYNPGIGTLSFSNTIIAGNTAPSGPDGSGANFISRDYNLIGDTSQAQIVGTTTHNITNVNAFLAPLGNNGGPTRTHLLLPGSPAIDAGDNCVLTNSCSPSLDSAITNDQRGAGFPRAIEANGDGIATVDIGAYEVSAIVVTNTLDSGMGSLRQAILDANLRTDGPHITFQPGLTGAISLLSALPGINASMGIAGPGADVLTVQRSTAGGTPAFRIFNIDSSGIFVGISGLRITNGSVSGMFPNSAGGGIFNRGILTLNNCIVTLNSGNGIFNARTLTVNNSIISNNSASNGGGIQSTATINTSDAVVLSVINSTISGNTATSFGAGISSEAQSGSRTATLTVTRSTISGNVSASSGGGIYNFGIFGADTTLRIDNSTISGNSAVSGGGLFHSSNGTGSISTGTMTNSTITANNGGDTADSGGGVALTTFQSSTILIFRNSIVARNFRSAGANNSDISGTADPGSSFNLIGDGSGMIGIFQGSNGNQVGVPGAPIDPRLGSLAGNGAPTQTHALLAGSPALDAGDNTLATNAGLTTDQRGPGFARIVDGPDAGTTGTVDIGAFEAQVSMADIPNQTINEDGSLSLPFNIGGTITSVTATSSNTTLVPNSSANITVSGSSGSRTLVITPAANSFGSSTLTVTVNGSNTQTMTDTLLLTVNPVNDTPSFTKGPDQTVNENDGAQTVNNWATNIAAGPANESGQTLTFVVSHDVDPSPFADAPAISSTGTLTYTPVTGFSGTATITVALQDNGGTVNVGDVNTSVRQSFTIQVLDGGALALSTSTYSSNENVGSANITITRSGGSAGTATVLLATSDGTATAEDYSSVSQTVTFLQGDVSKTINVAITDNLFKEPDETVNLTLSNVGGSGELGAQSTAVLTILDDDPIGGYIRFTSASFNTTEGSGSTTVSLERVGDLAQAVTVDYATSDSAGVTTAPCSTTNSFASSRCDYTTALGTLRFAAGEGSKAFAVLISQDNYLEGPEALTLTLSNLTGGSVFASPSAATLTITDDAPEPATNPIDNAEAFVRQHYHDFLNREPDAAGLAFWANQITECQQPGTTCNAEVRRINVSAAFFVSIEFQETGYLVYRFYKAAYGNITGTPVPLTLIEFLPDTQQIGQGVVVGAPNWEAALESNKVAYALAFVSRPRFTTAYLTTLTPAQFVDALFTNAGVVPSASDRNAAINEFGVAADTADPAARGRALRRVAENTTLAQQETNRAFVLMQYFGYLRRNPNDAPEPGLNFDGYNFWLGKLEEFNGNYIAAEMVKAFIDSIEYRQRFGP